mmetsp:Transcript_3852/g.6755  ORF Transcript_3852/g.6755 Transcript_3852/m.6755 type:complete len:122 (+) Transcript_3852:117-482(+)
MNAVAIAAGAATSAVASAVFLSAQSYGEFGKPGAMIEVRGGAVDRTRARPDPFKREPDYLKKVPYRDLSGRAQWMAKKSKVGINSSVASLGKIFESIPKFQQNFEVNRLRPGLPTDGSRGL